MKKKPKPVKAWGGVRWIIVSPWQRYEHTISHTRRGAWELFSFVCHRDVEHWKEQGCRVVKCNVQFKVLT